MAAIDCLELCGLEVDCIIGDLPHEREKEQTLVVDVRLWCDLAPVAACDRLEETVDYAALSVEIRETLRLARCRMIERAAALVAQLCLADARVERVQVRVAKSGCVPGLRAAVAMVERHQSKAL